MRKSCLYGILLLLSVLSFHPLCSGKVSRKKEKLDAMVERSLEVARQQALFMAETLKEHEGMLPKTYADGKLEMRDYNWWTAGFYPGVLWLLYENSEDEELLGLARHYTSIVEPVKHMTTHHDVGFIINNSFGHGYRLTGDPHYLEVIHTASNSLITRFNPKIAAIRSWDWNNKNRWKYPVIIDNMMNLEMLCFASATSGDSRYVDIAKAHANTTSRHHFRDDYSTWHVVSYDPETGLPHIKITHQGYSDDSAWARGQAWGLYGYTMMYRETGDPLYLEQARRIAAFLVRHPRLPEDKVPYWDFDAPDIPDDVRDASAASIMASALLELSVLDKSRDSKLWYKTAVQQLRSLSSERYLAEPGTNGGFILMHATGHKPGKSEVDVPLTYADYYYVEALMRLKKLR